MSQNSIEIYICFLELEELDDLIKEDETEGTLDMGDESVEVNQQFNLVAHTRVWDKVLIK